MSDRLVELLQLQRDVCTKVDVDPATIEVASDLFYEHLRVWTIAAEDELHEALAEAPGWKTWAKNRTVNRDAAFGELRDALQFLIDLMFLVTGDTAEELADRLVRSLEAKSGINFKRAEEGYDAVSGKCPLCKKDYEETRCFPASEHLLAWCETRMTHVAVR